MARFRSWSVSFLFFSSINCFPQSFLLQGRVTGPASAVHDFSVEVNQCSWLIQTRVPRASHVTWETASVGDGQIYKATANANTRTSNGIIESNAVPADCPDGVTPYLWLMLASSCHLQAITNVFLTPVYDLNTGVRFWPHYKLPATWRLFDCSPQAPREIIFFATNLVPIGGRIVARLNTNAVVRCIDNSTVDGLCLPTVVTFESYRGNPKGSLPTDLEVAERVSIIVTNAVANPPPTEIPPLLYSSAVIVDRRFLNIPPVAANVTYDVRDGKWPTMAEAQKIFGRQERRKMFSRLGRRLIPIFVGIVILPSMIFATVWLVRKYRKRNAVL